MEEKQDTLKPLERDHERLGWVVVDGELRDVSEFAHLPRQQRPAALCPQCERPVTLKLGKVRAHHAAHQPGDECAATAPETALHLNAKFHIAAELRAVTTVTLRERCVDCGRDGERTWQVPPWRAAIPERCVERLRPDVALIGEDQIVVAAVEVFVTNAVDEAKAKALADRALPWVEVRALDVIGRSRHWTRRRPLPVHRRGPEPPWRCDHCELRLEAPQRQEAQRRAEIEFAQANGIHRRFGKLVDLYYADGQHRRELVVIGEQRLGGRVLAVSIASTEWEARFVGTVVDNRDALRAAFNRWVQSWEQDGAEIVDAKLTGWEEEEKVSDLVAELAASKAVKYPCRYVWHGREWCKRIADQRDDLSGPCSSRRSAGWLFPIDELGSRPDPSAR